MAIVLRSHWNLERDGLLGSLLDLAHTVGCQLELGRDLLIRGLATNVLLESPRYPRELVDRLDHVDRDADRARLIGNGAGDRLADPPGRVRAELVALPKLE